MAVETATFKLSGILTPSLNDGIESSPFK